MDNIVDKIKTISKLYHASGCSADQIDDAQKLLNLTFPEDYVNYVKEYGAISFYRTEWSGLNVTGYLNVVENTIQERKLNPDFPDDCFVIENLGIDGKIVVEDVKSPRTRKNPEYIIKRKLMLERYGITIREVE